MTPEQKESCNHFLAKWTGECWHEFDDDAGVYWRCKKCRKQMSMCHTNNPNYFTPEGFFLLWNKAKESKYWDIFVRENISHKIYNIAKRLSYLIEPQVFPYEWARFLGWKKGGTDES